MSFKKISEKFVINKLKLLQHGNLKLVNYDGKVYHFGDLESSLSADIKINNPNFYFNIIIGGSSALGEAHMKKDFYSSNLINLIELTAKNINLIYKFSGSFKILSIKNFFKKILFSNTRSKSLRNIAQHYDLGNNFFSIWLDKTLTYSSAIYDNNNNDLEKAQKNKYQKLINLLEIRDQEKVLEIGCGWGGFSEYLAKKYDVFVDCITISKKQFEFTKKKIFENGLNNKVNVLFLDYRDLKERYNKIASIEMIEAVGDKYLNNYFKTIKNSLAPSGIAAIQGIIIKDDLFDRYKKAKTLFKIYFSRRFLPSLKQIKKITKNNRLSLTKLIHIQKIMLKHSQHGGIIF